LHRPLGSQPICTDVPRRMTVGLACKRRLALVQAVATPTGPSDIATGCSCPTSDNGQPCVCDCFSMPECPADLQGGGPTWPVACDHADSCMNCGGAGVICNCLDAGVVGADGGGSYWQCLGTEQACTGGTFHG
jgi:hypothetical protein